MKSIQCHLTLSHPLTPQIIAFLILPHPLPAYRIVHTPEPPPTQNNLTAPLLSPASSTFNATISLIPPTFTSCFHIAQYPIPAFFVSVPRSTKSATFTRPSSPTQYKLCSPEEALILEFNDAAPRGATVHATVQAGSGAPALPTLRTAARTEPDAVVHATSVPPSPASTAHGELFCAGGSSAPTGTTTCAS